MAVTPNTAGGLTPIETLGKSVFFDRALSLGGNQACADCHEPAVGGTGAVPALNRAGSVYPGSVPERFGERKPPSSSYATQAPVLHYVMEDGDALFIGGNFWDGRATGEDLGNPAADQARGPFLNPVEHGLADAACVVRRVCLPAEPGAYPVRVTDVWGEDACAIDWPEGVEAACSSERPIVMSAAARAKVNTAFDRVALAITAYEASVESNPFSSKFDAWLAGKAELTALEHKGRELFAGKGRCADCHTMEVGADGGPPLFTDYTYDNLGTPRNPDNPAYRSNPGFVDLGLGGFLATREDYAPFTAQNRGKHKVPTVRNVDLRPSPDFPKAYMHNGYFKTLEGMVHFYNTRDTKPVCADRLTREADALAQDCWPAPEVAANVNTEELGNLGLTAAEEKAIVAFMKALSDGYFEP
jgi:cytochrome c peroxidase